MIKHIAAAAVVLTASAAWAAPQYQLKRVPMGPRNDNYVLVRVDDANTTNDRPYALTGDTHERAVRPTASRVPSHPKGTHGW